MPLTLLPLTPALLAAHPTLYQRLAHVHLAAFLTNAVTAAIYPAGSSQTLVDSTADRHRTSIESDATARYLGVLDADIAGDADDGLGAGHANLIAFAKYHIFQTEAEEAARTDTGERTWPAEMNALVVADFWGQVQLVRRRWGTRLGPHVQLDVLATDPAQMRRGAGKMIMAEIGPVADRLGLPAFLEGSPEGVKLYRWAGFEDTGESVRLDLGRYVGKRDRGVDWRGIEGVKEGEERGGRAEAWYENAVMVRPAKGRVLEDYLDAA